MGCCIGYSCNIILEITKIFCYFNLILTWFPKKKKGDCPFKDSPFFILQFNFGLRTILKDSYCLVFDYLAISTEIVPLPCSSQISSEKLPSRPIKRTVFVDITWKNISWASPQGPFHVGLQHESLGITRLLYSHKQRKSSSFV